jgi:putative tricarboxylic transport membrane protein
MSETPDFIYRVGIYLALAAIAMWALALVISKVSVRILSLDKRILMPIIYVLCVIGSYLINYNLFDVKVMFVFGLIGIALSNFQFPASPFLLGVILGSMADQNLRRGLRLSKGSLIPMLQRPICVVFLIVNICMILSQTGLFKSLMKKWKAKRAEK